MQAHAAKCEKLSCEKYNYKIYFVSINRNKIYC